MRRFLDWLASVATRWPAPVLMAVAALTIAMAALATSLEVEVDLAQLGSDDSAPVQAMDRVRGEFGDPTAVLQVIIDAGDGGNILTDRGFDAVRAAERAAVDALGDDVRTDEEGRPQVLSLASAVEATSAGQGEGAAALGGGQLGTAAVRVVAADPLLAGLVSDDVDLAAGTARAAVVVVPLDPDLAEPDRREAGQRVQAALENRDEGALAEMRVTVFSSGLFVAGLLDAIRAEVPLLFGLALLVVVVILALMYRSLFDVAVGLVGLLATVVWTLGLAALLGPAHLGWTGPLTQFVVVIPVLLVGLGIDYSVHLTARYREQRAAGQAPPAAASRALHTVGAALVLATAATAVGFGSIAIAPLEMLADFGVFVAVGVVCAFLIMGLVVPAALVRRDRREARARAGAVRELSLGRLMRPPVWIAQRAPAAGLGVAALVVGASLLAATGLDVEFDRDDFVPEGSEIESSLAHQAELFGGGVTESTFVVVDADLTDPSVANAVWEGQKAVGEIRGVRTVGNTPQVVSVLSVAAAVLDPAGGAQGTELGIPPSGAPSGGARSPEAPRERPAESAWTGDGFAAGTDLRVVYDLLRHALGEERVGQILAPDAQAAVVQVRTTGGDARATYLQRQITAAFAPVERAGGTVTVTSEPIIVAEMSEDLSAFQVQSIGLTLAAVLVR